MIQKELRVLLVSPLPPPAGGIASWTKQYIDWSVKKNLSVEIVNTAVIGKRAEKINQKTKLLDELKRTKNIIKELKTKINEFKPQIIHLNTPCGKLGIIRDFLCAQMAKRNGVKLIVHYRCNIKDQVNASLVSRFYLKRLSNIADLNLVLNSSSSQYLMQETQNNSIIIANFINEDFVLEEHKKIRSDIKIISFVGHVQRTKGILEIIDVAKQFPEITFKIAGPVSSDINNIDEPNNLIFLGSLAKQEVKKLLLETDVFLFPTYTEGFANALLEAMAMGLPIITTPVGANEDMIETSGGILVHIKCVGDIISAINYLKDGKIRQKLSVWNVNKVKENYTIDNILSEIFLIYKVLIEDSRL